MRRGRYKFTAGAGSGGGGCHMIWPDIDFCFSPLWTGRDSRGIAGGHVTSDFRVHKPRYRKSAYTTMVDYQWYSR
jgi:hypothetical protein